MPADTLTLARHYLQVDQPERAVAALDEGDEALLESFEYWELRSAAELAAGRRGKSREAIRSGLSIWPEHPTLLWRLAHIELNDGNLAKAEETILKAIALFPESPDLIATYARVVTQAGQFEKAEALIAKASEIEPTNDEVGKARIVLAIAKGDDNAARDKAREALATAPDEAGLHATMGALEADAGRTSTAGRHLEQAAQLDLSTASENADLYREILLRRHPLMWPLAPIFRFGPWAIWGAFIFAFVALRAAGQSVLAIVVGGVYLVFCIYSWTVPPLLRRWYNRDRP